MDKDKEQRFLQRFATALESLPFDLKNLVEAVADPDLPDEVREQAGAVIIHALTPKDGHFEPALRYAEDVLLARLALRRVGDAGGEAAAEFRGRYADAFEALGPDLALCREVLGEAIMDWLDGRWPTLRKAVYAKRPIAALVRDEAETNALYDAVAAFATDYPLTEGALAGRLKQVQPIVEHLQRKLEQDRLRITH